MLSEDFHKQYRPQNTGSRPQQQAGGYICCRSQKSRFSWQSWSRIFPDSHTQFAMCSSYGTPVSAQTTGHFQVLLMKEKNFVMLQLIWIFISWFISWRSRYLQKLIFSHIKSRFLGFIFLTILRIYCESCARTPPSVSSYIHLIL